jgi:hypothetical protein
MRTDRQNKSNGRFFRNFAIAPKIFTFWHIGFLNILPFLILYKLHYDSFINNVVVLVKIISYSSHQYSISDGDVIMKVYSIN